MRLLQLQDNDVLSLVEFAGTNIPPYAILSHTWGPDDQEVTCQDIRDGTGQHKDGWHKIRFCGRQAKQDSLQYFWVDTCCIDKSSSQELSEAINSFFRWYQKATKCYVYLSDVSNDTSEGVSARRWKSAFRKSNWFTRGWTLQELIAPSIVEFFSKEGMCLGNKQSLKPTLHEVTGIAIEALNGALLSQFSKDERFSWSADRKTKRDEDAAYCLLGLFDVFMPLLYGEGQEKAFARLEEQIEKAPTGASITVCEEQKQKLMESLRFDEINARHMTIKSAHSKTCKWLLTSSEYLDWLNPTKLIDHHGFLWIKGKPGTGKSTMMKFVLANARKTMRDKVVIAYFFNARGEDLEKSTIGTYRSLLLQLLERLPALQRVFDSLYLSVSSINAEHQWSVESLKMLLEQAIQNLGTSSVVCFIDALDECEEQQVRDMIAFFERIGELVSTGARFQVCLSSRHYPNITVQRGLSLVLEAQEGHTLDIINYLKSELKIGESKIAQQIRNDVQEKASGVFMWVVLVVDILRQEYDRGRIHNLKRRLQEIPGDLHELFRDILTRDSRNKDELLLCIQWVLFAKQPLSPEQLYFAILSEVGPDMIAPCDSAEITRDVITHYLLDASKGLTETTRSKSPKIQFIHESVRDFFLKEDGLGRIWPDLRSNFEGQSQERLKQCCFTYMNLYDESLLNPLSQGDSSSRDSAASAFPFLEYSVQNVLYHSDAAAGAGIIQKDFIFDFPLTRWIKLDNLFEKFKVRRHSDTMSILYVLGERNFSNLIRSYPSVRPCFDVEEERYGAPFLAAVASRSNEAICAFVEVLCKDEAQQVRTQKTYVRYQQDKNGEKLLARDFRFPKQGGIVSFLIDLGNVSILALALTTCEVDVDARNKDGSTALMRAAQSGHKDIIQLLLGTGKVDVDAKSDHGYTSLMWAARGGHQAIVELLLSTGKVDVDAKNRDGNTALTLATINRRQAIVELLLGTGKIDVDAKSDRGYTSLMWAARGGHQDIVELLLGTGKVDVDTKSDNGFTSLMQAAENGHQDIVKLLLSTSKVDIDTKSDSGSTSLLKAAQNGHQAVVELLLGTGKVDVDAKSDDRYTSLMWAARNGNQDIVELLLGTSKVDVDAKSDHGYTSLMWAARNGHQDIVELLLGTGKVDVDAKSDHGYTSLMWAARGGHQAIVELLLSTGKVDVDAKNRDGNTALTLATINRRQAIVELLLGTGKIDVDAKSDRGYTSLMWAAQSGQEDIVKLLLGTGKVDVDAKNRDGNTALMLATEKGHRYIVKLLQLHPTQEDATNWADV